MAAPQDRETATQGNSLTPERFARVRAVFEAAVERPVAERRAFAAGACAGDVALLREVERLLNGEARAERVFDGVPSSSSSSPEEGRFPAGTALAGRYRILGLLGHGGMGEVYKAFDLILNQTVALKFLSPAHISEGALVRFRNEVRIARQVAHPNVCRVYDLGMVEGLHFLSMEYIDGEDLASLLRRIGRLPQDKAIEFTRKICAGLSAAHERGVLHRDLKPANIMIDGRGQVRITDFGLAGLAAEIPLSDLRSGTPAYMSPEQKAGKEVTTRSDIYSLGLVLHEMFTGKARKDAQSSPSEIVKDLDPAIERLLLRCLDEDPKRRPQTALNVAMALPGADPIAAALAAGETPSPEMVAASTEKEGLSPRVAIACCIAAIAFLIAGAALLAKLTVLNKARLDLPPDVLAYRAQELLTQLGYPDLPASTAYGFSYIPGVNAFWARNDPRAWKEFFGAPRPNLFQFWYRQHVDRFYADAVLAGEGTYGNGMVTYDSPANTEPGMARLSLDPRGRLLALEVRPRAQSSNFSNEPAPEWRALFTAAGLDMNLFRSKPSEAIPPMAADARAAWTGTYSGGGTDQVVVEAASWAGRPVYFSVTPVNPQSVPGLAARGWALAVLILATVFLGPPLLAWYNLRNGRGDRTGAARIGVAGFLMTALNWAIRANHVLGPWEARILAAGILEIGAYGLVYYWSYLAIEPYARKHWPDSLISWTRVLSGRFRDPLVASHILVGVAAVTAWHTFGSRLLAMAASAFEIPWPDTVLELHSSTYSVTMTSAWLLAGIQMLLSLLVIVVLLRLTVRNLWIADAIAAILFGLGWNNEYGGGAPWFGIVLGLHGILRACILLWLLRRFGLLASVAGVTAFYFSHVPFDAGSWYAGRTLIVLSVPALIAVWSLWAILSQKRAPSTESAA